MLSAQIARLSRATFGTSLVLGGLLLFEFVGVPAIAQPSGPSLGDAERSKACAKLQDEIKDAKAKLSELVAIFSKNPTLRSSDAVDALIKMLHEIDALKQQEADLCVVHFTMPLATPKPKPTYSLRSTCKAEQEWEMLQSVMQQLQKTNYEAFKRATAESAPTVQNDLQQLQNDIQQMAGPVRALCRQPQSGNPNTLPRS